MDKTELIKKLKAFEKEFGLNSDDYHLVHGGALLLLGLKLTTNDIDIVIDTKEVLDKLNKEGREVIELPNGKTIIYLTDDIEICGELEFTHSRDIVKREGIRLTNVKRILEDKKLLNRNKDQYWIKVLQLYLTCQKAWNDIPNHPLAEFAYHETKQVLDAKLGFKLQTDWR